MYSRSSPCTSFCPTVPAQGADDRPLAEPLLESSTDADSMKHLLLLKKPAALLNISLTSQASSTAEDESRPRQQPSCATNSTYQSPPRGLLRSTPTPAVTPLGLVTAYPLARGGVRPPHHMNGGPVVVPPSPRTRRGSDDSSIRPFPSLDGESPMSFGGSSSSERSSRSEELQSLSEVQKILHLEADNIDEATPTKDLREVSGKASTFCPIQTPIGTPSPKKTSSAMRTTPDTGTTEPSNASLSPSLSPSTVKWGKLSSPVPSPERNVLFSAMIHQMEEMDEVELILALSPRKKSLLDLHEQPRPSSPESPIALRETATSPSRILDLCGFSLHDWCNSNHFALPAFEAACGYAHAHGTNNGDDTMTHQQQMQNSICTSLGSMEGICQPWQKSYRPRSKIVVNHSKQKRNLDLNKRRNHLYSLRHELNPFSTRTCTGTPREKLSKSQSFNHYSSAPSKTRPSGDRSTASSLVCGFAAFSSTNHDSPAAIRRQWEDECQGYNSDPEDYFPKQRSNNNKENHPSTQNNTMNDKGASNLEEFLHDRSTFILHKGGKSVPIHIWVELGNRLNKRTILPKIVWRPCSDTYKTPTESMDLLDICRILKLDTIDRMKYPFARTDRLVQMHSVKGTVVTLEARSPTDRDRWLTLSKLAVSVFAAKLLTNDPMALALFFIDSESVVGPGREPELWKSPPWSTHKEAWV